MKYNNINTHYNHNNHNPKERRKCRKYSSLATSFLVKVLFSPVLL
jgi:hypothetical protein